MKTKFKILFVALAVCFSLSFGATCYAADEDIITDETDSPIEEPTAEVDETSGNEQADVLNPFDTVYNTALEYSTEIFSFLSLLGTILISYFYKRGLLPSVKAFLTGINSSVTKLKETSDLEIEKRREDSEKLEKRLLEFENSLKCQGELVSSLESRLISEEDIYRQREKSNLILSSQIDMLYDIFMSSSLPHFQKEAMSEKISSMRKELGGYESE